MIVYKVIFFYYKYNLVVKITFPKSHTFSIYY